MEAKYDIPSDYFMKYKVLTAEYVTCGLMHFDIMWTFITMILRVADGGYIFLQNVANNL
jgi:hypothetical protein